VPPAPRHISECQARVGKGGHVLTCVIVAGRVHASTWHDNFVAEMRRCPRSAVSFCCRRWRRLVHDCTEKSFLGLLFLEARSMPAF
jgi:hypothetical protein